MRTRARPLAALLLAGGLAGAQEATPPPRHRLRGSQVVSAARGPRRSRSRPTTAAARDTQDVVHAAHETRDGTAPAEAGTVTINNKSLVKNSSKGKVSSSKAAPRLGQAGSGTPFPTTESRRRSSRWPTAASAGGRRGPLEGDAAEARKRVADDKARVAELEAATKKLENDFYAWDDGQYRDRVIKPAWDQPRGARRTRRQRARGRRGGPRGPAREGARGGSDARMDPRMSGAARPVRRAGPLPAYRVETWGCQMNVLDGQRMAGQLESQGLRRAAEGEEPDVVLLNTCSVREKAEAKVFSELGVLGAPQAEHPELVDRRDRLRRAGLRRGVLERAPWVDFVLGTGPGRTSRRARRRRRRERGRALALELPTEDPGLPVPPDRARARPSRPTSR